MCGIGGIVGREIREVQSDASSAIQGDILFRGRDAQGTWTDNKNAHLIHARLTIIDPNAGQQPMFDVDNRYVVVFSGEIYNYVELREQWKKRGAVFRTESDTEAILEGYKIFGASVCEQLNGMFAFAIWDCVEKILFIARDRLGKKPFFWCSHEGLFYFSSSVSSLAAIRDDGQELCASSIYHYGQMGFFPEGKTIYTNIFSLPPGTRAVVNAGDGLPRVEKYWKLAFLGKSGRSLRDQIEEYEHILTDAIRMRLRSDVPIALTFSGGVDSGTIASLCARKLQSSLKCYTIDYHTASDPSEESMQAEGVARVLGLDWQYIHFDYHRQLLHELDDAYQYYDQPCIQLALVYSHRLYEAIKPFATVVLSGNGADELFTGYIGDEKTRAKGMVLSGLRVLRPYFSKGFSPYLRMTLPKAYAESAISRAGKAFTDPPLVDMLAESLRSLADEATAAGAETALDFAMFLSLTHGTIDSNYRIPDISGLAAQVEVRSPYLDYRMVEFATRVPDKYKARSPFSAGKTKYLPKRYYENLVPKRVAWSRKKGLGWNMQWGISVARDARFRKDFKAAFDSLDEAGIRSAPFRDAWEKHTAHMLSKGPPSPYGGLMMTGFMLGKWLRMKGNRHDIAESSGDVVNRGAV